MPIKSKNDEHPAKPTYKKPLEDNNNENEEKGPVRKKPFLKKGTRQFLSNA
jgi:centromere protein J